MENSNPAISVLMPVYNGERFLREAIDSILSQTFRDFELIIINDGSSDNTESIIKAYSDARIRYVKNEKNLRLIKTLNKGIVLAKGKYIARMDADDIASPQLFEKQIEAFEKDSSISIVNICTYDLSEDGKLYRKSSKPILFHSPILKYVIPFENQITHPGIMVRSELMKKNLYKDDGSVINFEDVDLWTRALWEGAKCITLTDRLLYYRINGSGVTRLAGNKRNDLTTLYCQKFLKEKFNIVVPDKDFLYFYYGDCRQRLKPDYCYSILKEIEQEIKQNQEDNRYVREFERWRKLRFPILLLQLCLSPGLSLRKRSLVSFYILEHFNLFVSSGFIRYFIFKVRNKWMSFK